jgi:hypothetical protein
MTHDLIANMLGVRRESITEAVHKLHIAGIIVTSRGHITVLDRAALEKITCECYAMIRKEYDRLLPISLRMDSPSVSGVSNHALRPVSQCQPKHGMVTKLRTLTERHAVEC